MIIDAHVHIPPDRDAWPSLRNTMAHLGISHCVVLPIGRWEHYPKSESVCWSNDEARAFVASSDGTASWLCYINPQNDDWGEELDRCTANGAIGIKLWVSVMDHHGCLERCKAVLARAETLGLPVLAHTYDRSAEPNLPGELNLAQFADLAETFPKLPMVAAHAGADWRSGLGILRDRAPNSVVDISGSFPESGMVEALVAELGEDRVVFGSDACGRSMASQLSKVTLATVSDAAREGILWRNAARIFGLQPQTAKPLCSSPPTVTAHVDTTVDHYCFCGHWPFFSTAAQSPAELATILANHRVETAYTADLGSIYNRDLEAANAEFAKSADRHAAIQPLATVNPTHQNWQHILATARPNHPGVIVYPALQGWSLNDPGPRAFFATAAASGWPVWVNAALGDERFRHCGTVFRHVGDDELRAFVDDAPANAYVFQGLTDDAASIVLQAAKGIEHSSFRIEISRLTDRRDHYAAMLNKFGPRHFVHGSEFPLRHPRQVAWTAHQLAQAAATAAPTATTSELVSVASQ